MTPPEPLYRDQDQGSCLPVPLVGDRDTRRRMSDCVTPEEWDDVVREWIAQCFRLPKIPRLPRTDAGVRASTISLDNMERL